MHALNNQAAYEKENKNYKESIKLYKQCIKIKPSIENINDSRIRRWCQNNLASTLANCSLTSLCNPKESLHLAKQLMENHFLIFEIKYNDVIYRSTLAEAYYANGKLQEALKHIKISNSEIEDDSPWKTDIDFLNKKYQKEYDEQNQ